MIRLLVGLWAGLLLPLSAPAAPPAPYSPYALAPVDEAKQDKSFLAFRAKLLQAIERRDSNYVLSILTPNIAFSFGGQGDGDGPEGFRRMWSLGQGRGSRKSNFWKLIKKVVQNGGTFSGDGTSFSAPYVSATWPSTFNSYDFIAVIEKNVSVKDKPAKGAREIAKVSHELVRLIAGRKEAGDSWAAIMLPDGQRGFIQNKYLQSAVGYRARFEKRDGKWMMATFIVGT